MSTFRELTYMALDELKLMSDDSYYTEDHVLFLLNKYRSFLLKQRYSDIKKQMPESNYQTLSLDLEQYIPIIPCRRIEIRLSGITATTSWEGVLLCGYLSFGSNNIIALDLTYEQVQDISFVKDLIVSSINTDTSFTAQLIGNNIIVTSTELFTQVPVFIQGDSPISYVYTIYPQTIVGDTYLKTIDKIPYIMQIGNPRVYPIDYYKGDIALVSRDRMRYVGYNKFLENTIYCSINPDTYLYFKSNSITFLDLTKVYFTAIFQDCIEAASLQDETVSDLMDKTFPIEEALISPLIELTVKELSGFKYLPKDDDNNASDDLSNIQVKK